MYIQAETKYGGEGGIILSAFGRQAPRKWLRLKVRACARGGQIPPRRILIPPRRAESSMVNREALGLIGAGGEEEKFCRQHLELYSSGFSGHRFSRGYHPGVSLAIANSPLIRARRQ